MALINLIVKDDRETKNLLREINCKLDKLLAGNDDAEVIKKATEDLKNSSGELKTAVEKNKQ